MSISIKILSSKDIDKDKWDACVVRNENGLIYARSFYLDAMTEHWDGLVVNDYETVMPFVWKRKFGVKYFCGVSFIQQLGVIGIVAIPEEILLKYIRSFAWCGDVAFNFKNGYCFLNVRRTNQFLLLNNGYQSVYDKYKDSLKRNIKKAIKNNLRVSDGIVEDIKRMLAENTNDLGDYYKNDKIAALLELVSAESNFQYYFIRKVVDESNKILSIALFMKDEKRIYNTLLITSEIGRKLCSMPLLIDSVLNEYSGTNLIFDFQGSDMSGIKTFNSKFSSNEETYFIYKYARHPFFSILKRFI
ncbi:hypothetical protein A9P82_09585 [Arachidicoccus ginsenosidimutans]|uniref:hypothetical protein n=1 Tax=Arachidicoccus sp. BS20 TaxID=1850526 RepID=UPI0007F07F07|nr:hypothetical protein [Arachidicoccus sp. BS20]ANI89518.1 hypothetical protein A9P82_09585 [Arachidicoccus sp. BS20]